MLAAMTVSLLRGFFFKVDIMLRIVTLVLYLVDLLSALIVRLTRRGRGHTYDIYIIVVSYIRPLGSRLFFI